MGIRNFARMPGIGHMPQLEDSAAFKALLTASLQRLSSGKLSGWNLRGEIADANWATSPGR